MPDSAYKYLKAYSSLPSAYLCNLEGGLNAVNIYYAKYYESVANPDIAIAYYKDAMSGLKKNAHLSVVCMGLANCYNQMGKTDSSLVYESMYAKYKDEVYDATVAKESLNVKNLYDYSIEQKKADQKSLEALRFRTFLLWCLVAVALLVIVVVTVMYRNLMERKRIAELYLAHQSALASLRKSEAEQHSLTVQKQELEHQLTLAEDKTGVFQKEIDRITDELTQNLVLADEQMQKVKSLENIISHGKNQDKDILLYNSEIVDRFRRAITSRGYTIERRDWKQLRSTVEEFFPTFMSQVDKENNMPETDLRVCLLVKARFSPSDIDYLMQMKHSYATNARKRLHERIFGFPGSATDFDKKILFIQ